MIRMILAIAVTNYQISMIVTRGSGGTCNIGTGTAGLLQWGQWVVRPELARLVLIRPVQHGQSNVIMSDTGITPCDTLMVVRTLECPRPPAPPAGVRPRAWACVRVRGGGRAGAERYPPPPPTG